MNPADDGARALAVFDIDGVIADVTHRLHHLDSRPKNWHAFFAAAGRDPLLAPGAELARTLAQTFEIRWLTGRPERTRAATSAWLRRHELPEGELRMRRERDYRPSTVVKVAQLHAFARERPVHVMVDDDPEVCAAVEAAGYAALLATWMARPPSLSAAQEQEGRT